MFDYSASALIASIRRRAMLPDTQGAWSDANVLAVANEQVRAYLVPMLLQMAEEYLVVVGDGTTVANTPDYALPQRAIGQRVRDVLTSLDGGTTWQSLPRFQPENQPIYPVSGTPNATGYYLQANALVFVPTPTTAFAYKVKYFRRPDALVSSGFSNASGYNAGTNALTVGSTTGMSTGYFYLYNSSTFEIVYEDIAATVAGSTSLTLTLTDAQETYVQNAYASLGAVNVEKIPSLADQLPVESFDVLSQRAASQILDSLGDSKAERSMAVAQDMERRLKEMLSPRTEGLSRKYVNRFGPGFPRWPVWRPS